MTRPIHILRTSIATLIRPSGEDDDIPDADDQANWDDLASKIGQSPEAPEPNQEGEQPEETAPKPKEGEAKPEDDASSKVTKKDEVEDKELEKFQPHPHASEEVKTQFKALKTQTKTYKQERDAFKTQLDTATAELETAKKAQSNPEEIKTLKEENERLRKAALIVDLEESEEFKTTYSKPIDDAKATLKSTLMRLNMSEKMADQAIAQGEGWPRWDEAMKLIAGQLDKEEVLDLRRTVKKASLTKAEALQGLKGPEREKFLADRQAKEREGHQTFWKGTAAAAQKLLDAEGQHMSLEKIPDNATPEQKKALESRNQVIKDRNAETSDLIRGSYVEKNPESLATLAFRAANSLFLQEQLTTAKSELAEVQKRLTEAEAKIGKANKIGKEKVTAGTSAKKTGNEDELEELSAGEAMDRARAAGR